MNFGAWFGRSDGDDHRSGARSRPPAQEMVTETPLTQDHRLRPTARYLLIVGVLLILIRWPLAVVIAALAPLALFGLVRLWLGPGRLSALTVGGYRRLAWRRPELAEALRRGADHLAAGLDAILDRLPGSWVRGLYPPDLSAPADLATTLETGPEGFDRHGPGRRGR